MVREVDVTCNNLNGSIDHIATKFAAHDEIQVEDIQRKDSFIYKQTRSTSIDEESGFSESSRTPSIRASPVPSLTDEDYQFASILSDESKKEFCSDMGLVFHAEFQLTFGRYFPDSWILLPLDLDGPCKLPTDTICDVEIAKVRFECDACRHCWTSMRGQISFFFHCQSHVLYFKLFTQNCDQCGTLSSPLWYPEEVCRVIRNVFVNVQEKVYPDINTPIQANHHRRFGNPKGQHHGCESCRDGVCVALAAQQLGCKLVK